MVLIVGVTASGKGRLAFDLARQIGAEIVSIDSMKVYRRMDIGTGKPPAQVRRQVRHHLIDVVEPSEAFSVGRFLELADAAIERIKSAGKPVIAVGGSAMYIKALLYGLFEGPGTDEKIRRELKRRIAVEGTAALHAELAAIDPLAGERIRPNDARRIIRALEVYQLSGEPISALQQQGWTGDPIPASAGTSLSLRRQGQKERKMGTQDAYRGHWKIIALRRDKADANSRINTRVKRMIEQGLVNEVKALLAEDRPLSRQARSAIGYAEIIDYLAGAMSLDKAIEKIKINTRRFAKSQRTWFKAFRSINWLDVAGTEGSEQVLERAIKMLDSL